MFRLRNALKARASAICRTVTAAVLLPLLFFGGAWALGQVPEPGRAAQRPATGERLVGKRGDAPRVAPSGQNRLSGRSAPSAPKDQSGQNGPNGPSSSSNPNGSSAPPAQSAPEDQYFNDRIIAIAKSGATDAQVAQVAQAAAAIDGAIAGQVNPVGLYWVQFSSQRTEAQPVQVSVGTLEAQ